MVENIIGILIITATIVLGLQHRNERKTYKDNLLQSSSFSIGEVSYYRSGRSPIIVPKMVNSTGRSPKVEYFFTVGDKTYYKKYDSFTAEVPSDSIQVGEKYLILYKEENPEESRMFFDYPIKDSTDFKRYVKEFEELRKAK